MKIAVTTKSGFLIDLHFGQANTFTVYDVDTATGTVSGPKTRPGLGACLCDSADGHDEAATGAVLDSLADCKYLLTARIGQYMERELAARGVTSFEVPGEIEPAIDKIVQYEQKFKGGKKNEL
jgi:predicted Fe-Mo cluster-binding NifX family protein